jgi:serine/threonine protein kinase
MNQLRVERGSALDQSASDSLAAERLRREFASAWRHGQRPDAVEWLGRSGAAPEFGHSLALDLAYEEFCQRTEAGEELDVEAYCARFPELSVSLRRLLDVHHLLAEEAPDARRESANDWPALGADFQGFRLLDELGRGAFARVYLAAETALGDRPVALKVCRDVRLEAELLGKLQHPNIVMAHSIVPADAAGRSGLVMPFRGRTTLNDVLDHLAARNPAERLARPLPADLHPTGGTTSRAARWAGRRFLNVALQWGAQLADALQHAHAAGVLHCDLKPSNVLLDDEGRPLLLDFNLSRGNNGSADRLGGTLPYMSPEQIARVVMGESSDDALDGRTDVYSLGVLLYELLTGRQPFDFRTLAAQGDSVQDTGRLLIEAQRQGCAPLRDSQPGIDRATAQLVERCLSFDPDKRPASAGELAKALRGRMSLVPRSVRWFRARPMLAGLLLAAAATALGVPAGYVATRDTPAQEAARKADEMLAAGLPDAAASLYEQAVLAEPNLYSARLGLARAFQAQGKLQKAFEAYAGVYQVRPDWHAAAGAGYCAARLREWHDAERYLSEALRFRPESAETWNNLGFCRLRQTKLANAHDCFERALALDKDLPSAHSNRTLLALCSWVKSAQPVPDGVLEGIDATLQRGARSPRAYLDAARLHAISGHDRSAVLERVYQYLSAAYELGGDLAVLDNSGVEDPFLRDYFNEPHIKKLLLLPPKQANKTPGPWLVDPLAIGDG